MPTASRSTSLFRVDIYERRRLSGSRIYMSVWWHHNLSLDRVANFCVLLQTSEQINTSLQTVGPYCRCLGHFDGMSVPGKGGIRFRRRKTYYLDQMDHSVRIPAVSDLGEALCGECITNQPFSKFCPS